MTISKWILGSAVGVSALVAPGCATDAQGDDVSEGVGAESDALLAGTTKYKMYGEIFPTIRPSCDRYTEFTVTAAAASSASVTGRLETKLLGACELAVIPNVRSFTLRKTGTADRCGTVNYTGTLTTGGRSVAVTMADNTRRTCENIFAPIHLTVGAGSSAESLFSNAVISTVAPAPAAPAGERLKMYERPNTTPDAFCDLYTDMVVVNEALTGGGVGKRVTFETKLAGSCERTVFPNKQTFLLRTASTSRCARIWYGTGGPIGGAVAPIQLHDSRGGSCGASVSPVRVEVQPARGAYTLYSGL